MSKDRDGIADGAGGVGDDADDVAQARAAFEGDAPAGSHPFVSDPTAAEALTDPETEIADAEEVQAEIEAAEEAAGVDSDDVDADFEDDLDSELVTDSDLDDEDAADEVVEEAAMAGAGATAVGAGSARAAARGRAPVRSGTTAKKAVATRVRDTPERAGLFGRLSRFLREVVAELRKVIWPSRRQMVTYTVVVIVFLAVMVALVAGLDVLFLYLAGALFA